MNINDTVTAPQVEQVRSFYNIWLDDHTGTLSDFYDFMTDPTVARDDFIRSFGRDVSYTFCGEIMSVTLRFE